MKRKLIVAAGVVVAVVSAVTGTALYLSRILSVSFECKVDFLYEFDRPFKYVPARGVLNANEQNRNARYESIADDFRREMRLCTSKDVISTCQRDSAFKGESESRVRNVLSSVRLDVTGMPSTNFVYPCRLVLSDCDSRSLEEYARFCMDRVKAQVDEENNVSVAKCTVKEHQILKKAERKIEELSEASVNSDDSSFSNDELRLANQTATEMKNKIEDVRRLLMSTGGRRIIYESQPETSWVIRRKAKKHIDDLNYLIHQSALTKEIK